MAKIISLVDVIGDDPKALFDQLPTNGEDVKVEIDSPGGSVDTAMAFYNKLLELKGKVTTDVLRLAASAATIPMQAASQGEREIRSNARIMIHNPYTGQIGDSKEFQKTADELKALENELAELYSGATGIPVAKMLEMMNAETTMTAQEAVDNGFADKVIQVPAKKVNIYTPKMLMEMGFKKIPKEFQTPARLQMDEENIMIDELTELLDCKADEILDKIKALISAAAKAAEGAGTGDSGNGNGNGEVSQEVQRQLDEKDTKIDKLEGAVKVMTTRMTEFTSFQMENQKESRLRQLDVLLKGDGKIGPKITPAQYEEMLLLLELKPGNFAAFDAVYPIMAAGQELDLQTTDGSGGEGEDLIESTREKAKRLADLKLKENKTLTFAAALQLVFDEDKDLEKAYNDEE